MRAMENGSSSISSIKAASKRGKRFRKLRWKNYLNHLLNLWLYCGNVSADGLNYYGANGSQAVNFHNKIHAENEATLTTSFGCNGSLKPMSDPIANGNQNETLKSLHNISDSKTFESDDERRWKIESDSKLDQRSNTSRNSREIFPLTESVPVRKDESINHENNSSHSSERKGPSRPTGPEKIVNARGMTSDIELVGRVKKSKIIGAKNSTSEGENKLSIHYNQSSYRSSQLPKNPTNQTGKKRMKSVIKAPSSEKKSTISGRGEKKLSKVSLLGLFEMTTHLGTRWEGQSELAAAELAVKHINERGLLPGYLLELITNDTQVS